MSIRWRKTALVRGAGRGLDFAIAREHPGADERDWVILDLEALCTFEEQWGSACTSTEVTQSGQDINWDRPNHPCHIRNRGTL